MRPVIRILAMVAALSAVLTVAGSAFAHAEPEQVSPGADAVVTSPPGEVVILMSQEVVRGDETGIDVVNEAGEEVTTLDAIVDNGNRKRVSVLLPSSLEPGVYTVRWRTLSAEDDDNDSGEYSFTYNPDGPADPGREQLRESVLQPSDTETPPSTGPVVIGQGGGGGTSWVLVAAVGVGMLTLGSGVTFLLVQKRG